MFLLLVWPFTQEGESKCSDLLEAFEKLAVDDDKSVVEFSDEVAVAVSRLMAAIAIFKVYAGKNLTSF